MSETQRRSRSRLGVDSDNADDDALGNLSMIANAAANAATLDETKIVEKPIISLPTLGVATRSKADNSITAMKVDETSSTSSSSDSSDSSDSEDSSEMDDETSEKRIQDFTKDLSNVEDFFYYIRELFYHERLQDVEKKLSQVKGGNSPTYLNPLAELQENMRNRITVAGKLRELKVVNMQHKYDAEEIAAKQNFESEKSLLHDTIKTDLEDGIHRLEEDRNNDFSSELWLDNALKRKNKKLSLDLFGDKKKKPVTVCGPYVVYNLADVDIVEDWTIIKKALAAPKRKYNTSVGEMVF